VDDLPLTITDLPSAERWQKILSAMNSGEMPPEDEKQPDAKSKTELSGRPRKRAQSPHAGS